MKSLMVFAMVALVGMSGNLYSQEPSPTWEVSLSGAFGSFTQKIESGTQSQESEPQKYGVLTFRPGILLGAGFSFEPEVQWSAFTGTPPSFFFSGNLGLTASLPGLSPFIIGGIGVGNSFHVIGILPGRMTDKFDVKLLNGGGGLKIQAGENAALRVEYRYQRYTYTQDDPGYPPFYPASTRTHTIFLSHISVGYVVYL